MKVRSRFVSNSSSSSFVIQAICLTAHQYLLILDHPRMGARMGLDHTDDPWDISTEYDNYRGWLVKGSTWMDNFSMDSFLHMIGVPDCAIEWERGH